MPKKMHVMEPAVIFHGLFKEFMQQDNNFVINTPDSVPELWADTLINEHFPSQTQLPID